MIALPAINLGSAAADVGTVAIALATGNDDGGDRTGDTLHWAKVVVILRTCSLTNDTSKEQDSVYS